jgi:hypothetical protein
VSDSLQISAASLRNTYFAPVHEPTLLVNLTQRSPMRHHLALLVALAGCGGGTVDPTDTTLPTGPTARWEAAMTYDPVRQQVVMLGGSQLIGSGASTTTRFFGDAWAWNGSRWTPITSAVPPRDGVLLAYDTNRERIVFFGGRDPQVQGGANVVLSETWELQGSTPARVATIGPTPARLHFGGGYDVARGRLVLFGGGDPGTTLRDTWEWDGTQWSLRASTTPSITVGAPSKAVFLTGRNAVVMLVGSFSSGPTEIWQWSGSVWSKVGDGPRGEMPMEVAATGPNDLVIFDGGTGLTYHWNGTTTSQLSSTGPGQRFGAAMAYDASRHRVVLFGGYRNGQNLADTWLWTGTAWTQAP